MSEFDCPSYNQDVESLAALPGAIAATPLIVRAPEAAASSVSGINASGVSSCTRCD
jgi:hypothetical protein